VIVVDAERAASGDPQRFDLFAQSVPATLVRAPQCEELLLGGGLRSLRLSIVSGTLLAGPVRLSYHLAGTDSLETRLLALRRFAGLQRHSRIPKSLFPVRPHANRWARVISALEALAIDPSPRAVAIRVYGEAIVAAEWDGSSDFLRSRVRRLTAWARHLAAGGYLSLLKK
jgi:hypothetical protein